MLRILLASTLLLTACASRKLSQPADLVSASTQVNLEISSEIIHEYTDPYNVVMQINLESKDGQWIRVDSAELDLTNTDGIVQNIIIGKDLNAWLQAKAEEKMIREQNADITSLGLISAGMVLATLGATQNNNGTLAAGGLAVGGASSYLMSNEIRRNKAAAQHAKWIPETHLYVPFTIPSMSLVKRWILINSPSGRVNRKAILRLKTVEGETLTYNIYLAGK
ncbi:hypothetical protein AZI86_18135 [Bdellovibrio bacteriovorus]|uniref:Lipoprotein n=1 Tax=Bdellovibrio bacteriovorus TaxID=959 RepID=A0A150WFA2_BDEBC|nr:hypothetical protein [Bdellovibrio bacteriovorus]KYG61623.1 hypothetical protein AZI86_18135 [Bdellovibrio bacteriovorus]